MKDTDQYFSYITIRAAGALQTIKTVYITYDQVLHFKT